MHILEQENRVILVAIDSSLQATHKLEREEKQIWQAAMAMFALRLCFSIQQSQSSMVQWSTLASVMSPAE
jgi:hypothetical protein